MLTKYTLNDGDLVRVKDQHFSPEMTVHSRYKDNCKCVWFNPDGHLFSDFFSYGCLTVIKTNA